MTTPKPNKLRLVGFFHWRIGNIMGWDYQRGLARQAVVLSCMGRGVQSWT